MVSYEIHDGLIQQLAAAMMQFEMFSRVTGPEAKEVWKTFPRAGWKCSASDCRKHAG